MHKKLFLLLFIFCSALIKAQVVARLDSFTINENSTTIFKVQTNDDTCVSSSGSIIRMNTPPINGLATRSIDFKSFSYTPKSNFYGKDSFRYTLVGCISSDTFVAWVYIKVLPVNQPPKAINDSVMMNEDTSIVIDVQNNDSDRESLLLATQLDIAPLHGNVVVLAGFDSIRYTPFHNYYGRDSFKYSISDDATGSSGLTASAWVQILIRPIYDTFELTTTLTNITVLEDSVFCMDLSSFVKEIDTINQWKISISTASKNGKDSIKNRTTICYRPLSNFNGLDSITINICDTNNVCKAFKLKITVIPVQDSLVAKVDSVYVTMNRFITFKPSQNDINIDNAPLVISLSSNPIHGIGVLSLDSVKYIPQLNYIGTDSQIYKISVIGTGQESSAKILYFIIDTTSSPIANADCYIITKGKTKNLNVLFNDSLRNPPCKIKSISTSKRVKASIHTNGYWLTVTGDSIQSNDTFYYELCDKFDHCDTALIIIKTRTNEGTYFSTSDTANLISGLDYTGYLKGYQNNLKAPLSYVIIPTNSIPVTIDNLGKWTYNYPIGYKGFDSFYIVICDQGFPALCDTVIQYINITLKEDSLIRISNSLSPNMDGLNDYLKIENIHLTTENNLKVFNRWGDIVLDRNQYQNDWNGINDKSGINFGTILPDGIYFYIFNYSLKNKIEKQSGYIHLKR